MVNCVDPLFFLLAKGTLFVPDYCPFDPFASLWALACESAWVVDDIV